MNMNMALKANPQYNMIKIILSTIKFYWKGMPKHCKKQNPKEFDTL